ncbi:MAG: hypothetical protein RI907_3157 [Pseudomonadota bacterium]|jgi:hypothetical protein
MNLRSLLRPRYLVAAVAAALAVSTTGSLLVACAPTSPVVTPAQLDTARQAAESVSGRWQPMPRGTPATGRAAELQGHGYIEEEWRLQGQAKTYSSVGTWGRDGQWTVAPRDAAQPFDTRVLVRRPQDPARFNGMVVVEWLNTSLGLDLDGVWMVTRDELMREGYAWVGVSAEAAGTTQLASAMPERYGHTQIATGDMGFDIYTLTALQVRMNARMWGPPGRPLSSIKLIGAGYSKSASYLISYINAFNPLTQAFDGFYLRGATPAAIQVRDVGLNVIMPRWRSDLKTPLMQVQTEGEVKASWVLSDTPDSAMVRYWEIAGAVHFDAHMQQQAQAVGERWGLRAPQCRHPVNSLPAYLVDHAALAALRQWVLTGQVPPKAPRLQRSPRGWLTYDDVGNVQGGIRLPGLSLGLAEYHAGYTNWPTQWPALWNTFSCVAGGATIATAPSASLAGQAASASQIEAAAQALVQAGLLKPQDLAEAVRTAHRPQ